MNPSDATVIELKEKLKELGQSTTGNKPELIQRLMEIDPSAAWLQSIRRTRESGDVSDTRPDNGRIATDAASPEASVIQSDSERLLAEKEIDLYRREKELAERELEFVRRELERMRSLRDASASNDGRAENMAARPESVNMATRAGSVNMAARAESVNVAALPESTHYERRVNILHVADFLNHYKGDVGEYENWEKQLKMIKTTYGFTDDQLRILFGMRLKGRALEWLYSKSEHIGMPVKELLAELRRMYHRRKNKTVLRKSFEARMWKKDETFHEYVHDKIILSNKVPIPDDEIIDYIIEGIPDVNLRDQARIQKFRTTADILEAFEKVDLRDRRQPNSMSYARHESERYNRDKTEKTVKTVRPERTERAERGQKSSDGRCYCFNCGSPDHMSDRCPTKSDGPKCFKYNERGHIASRCPKKRPVAKESCVISEVARKKCMKVVKINGHLIEALIDTGSDFCLMRADQYIKLGSPRLEAKELKFAGVGSTNTT